MSSVNGDSSDNPGGNSNSNGNGNCNRGNIVPGDEEERMKARERALSDGLRKEFNKKKLTRWVLYWRREGEGGGGRGEDPREERHTSM